MLHGMFRLPGVVTGCWWPVQAPVQAPAQQAAPQQFPASVAQGADSLRRQWEALLNEAALCKEELRQLKLAHAIKQLLPQVRACWWLLSNVAECLGRPLPVLPAAWVLLWRCAQAWRICTSMACHPQKICLSEEL